MDYKKLIPFFVLIVVLIFIKVFTPEDVIRTVLDYVSLIIYFAIALIAVLITELMIKRKEHYKINHHQAKIAWSLIAFSAILFAIIQLLYMTTNIIDKFIIISNFKILVEFIWLDAFYIFYRSIK